MVSTGTNFGGIMLPLLCPKRNSKCNIISRFTLVTGTDINSKKNKKNVFVGFVSLSDLKRFNPEMSLNNVILGFWNVEYPKWCTGSLSALLTPSPIYIILLLSQAWATNHFLEIVKQKLDTPLVILWTLMDICQIKMPLKWKWVSISNMSGKKIGFASKNVPWVQRIVCLLV